MLHNNLDILLISETKIDSSFPTAQFQIEGYTTYRLDRNANGGGILLYIREDIPSTLLNFDMSIESFFIEINIRKKKWLLVGTYNPNKNLISNHLKEIGKNLDNYSSKYGNFILLGDLNSEPTESAVKDFCEIYSCKNLIKDNTCFKNPLTPSCIDLIITNRPKSFQNSVTVETGLSDCNINTSDITDNKTFWKTVKPFFTDKIKTKSKITLIEKNIVSQEGQEKIVSEKIITEDQAVAEVFNNFFINIVPNLKISTNHGYDNDFIATDDQVTNAVNKFWNHSSIIMIKNKKVADQSFSFGPVTYDDVLKIVNTLDTAKASQQSDIPTKILKQNSDYFAEYFYENINQCISKSIFPSDLKLADVTPVYKKKSKNSKDNYRPVSILSNISKIYERCIYDQIQLFFDSLLSKYQCGFRRGYNAQHCLITLIEKWKKSVDNGGGFGALLTDLSKAFDCLPHELLIAKLDAYGFDKSSLKLMHSYLSNRKQRVKINDTYSSWSEILFGVPQGSILGPLLFNIFICDMFYFLEGFDIANYAEDSTPYCAGKSAESVVNNLEQSSTILFKWLNNNYMKVNTGKSHLLLSGNSRATATIDNSYIESEDEQVLLGITIDSNLTFENHIRNICKKASQKLNALARIAPYMNIQKRRTIMKSFVTSQFSYCPLIWMFHSRRLNNKINSIHERALRITYQDNVSTFQELLNKDNSVSIHHRNLQVLATEMFKIHRGLSPEILRETFVSKTSSYNLRRNDTFGKRKVHSVYHGTESLSFLGPKIWDLVPVELKQSETLYSFKLKIKNWLLFECPCRICKT